MSGVESAFAILAEPSRRAILGLLASSERSVGELRPVPTALLDGELAAAGREPAPVARGRRVGRGLPGRRTGGREGEEREEDREDETDGEGARRAHACLPACATAGSSLPAPGAATPRFHRAAAPRALPSRVERPSRDLHGI